jgi:hypothetical protein
VEVKGSTSERASGFQLRADFTARVRGAVDIHVEIALLEALELIIRER